MAIAWIEKTPLDLRLGDIEFINGKVTKIELMNDEGNAFYEGKLYVTYENGAEAIYELDDDTTLLVDCAV